MMESDTQIVIAGTAPHCGTYMLDEFLRDVARPFGARFSEPPAPKLRQLWAHSGSVAVLADATGTTRDQRHYENQYVFVFQMVKGRVTRVTEFLDMTAFNEVWDRVDPAPQSGDLVPVDQDATGSQQHRTTNIGDAA